MKKPIIVAAAASFSLATGSVAAQEEQRFELPSKVVPAEIFTCNFNDGQGPADLDRAVAGWSQYLDDNDVDDYAAWTLTKNYYGPDQEFDFIWLGAWKDGNAMGAGMDMWFSTGGAHLQNFYRVATCGVHVLAGSINYRLPDGGTPADSVLTFSNCTVRDGASYPQVANATRSWVEALDASGSEAAIFHWFPAYGGGGDETPDYLNLIAYPDYAALGADFERYTNGEMFRQFGALFNELVDCDVARVYNAKNRRAAQLREE